MIRVAFYLLFRNFEGRDVLFWTGMALLAMAIVSAVVGGVAVWKQMGRRSRGPVDERVNDSGPQGPNPC